MRHGDDNVPGYMMWLQNADFTNCPNVTFIYGSDETLYRETFRVLKKGGIFCGCFYIQGGYKRTDWFVRHLYVPKGFFTPPFETEASLRNRLNGMYNIVQVELVEGIGTFQCRK